MIRPFSILPIALLFAIAQSAVAQDDYKPKIADASKDAELALKGFRPVSYTHLCRELMETLV